MSEVPNISRIFENAEEDWKPKNCGSNFQGLITLKQAPTTSRNLAAINLVLGIGLDVVYSKLLEFGSSQNVPADLSIMLGNFGTSPLEFAKFYTMFGNYGMIKEPVLIREIKNKNEALIAQLNSKETRASEAGQTFLVSGMMKSVVEKDTGRNARVADIEIAGRAGTLNESIDAWFCGLTLEIEALIWYGNGNNKPMRYAEGGARTVAPVSKDFLTRYTAAFPETKRKFDVSNDVRRGTYNNSRECCTPKSPLPNEKHHQDEILL